MDTQLARTFLTVMSEGSFVAAAEKLFVTQSAVSLRIRRLEEQLGRTLFERSKAGVTLTPAGRQFERYAIASLRIWEEARHLVAVPDRYARTLLIGAAPSLLPRLALRLLAQLEKRLPDTAFRVETGRPDRLIRMMLDGTLDLAITYKPELRPGLKIDELFQDELVMVSARPDFEGPPDERYVYLDWGPEFLDHHAASFPDMPIPRCSFGIGALALDFVIRGGRAGYFPARVVREHLDGGGLHLVPNAPAFSYPCYAVTRADMEPDLADTALAELRRLAEAWDTMQGEMLDTLETISIQ